MYLKPFSFYYLPGVHKRAIVSIHNLSYRVRLVCMSVVFLSTKSQCQTSISHVRDLRDCSWLAMMPRLYDNGMSCLLLDGTWRIIHLLLTAVILPLRITSWAFTEPWKIINGFFPRIMIAHGHRSAGERDDYYEEDCNCAALDFG